MQNQTLTRGDKLVDKFFASVDERESKEKCWNWTGPIHANGYARLAYGKVTGPNFYFESGHRFSYHMHYGKEIPKGMSVLHKCDNRKCVNPFHLFLGTQMDNMKDKISKGRDSKGEKHSLSTKLKTPRGSRNPAAKLKEEDVPKIVQMRNSGMFYKDIADKFGISKVAIRNICIGKTWKHMKGEV